MITKRYICEHLGSPFLKIENENNIFCYEKVNLEEIDYEYIDLFDSKGNFVKKGELEVSSRLVNNQEISKSSLIRKKILFNYKNYNLYYSDGLNNISQLCSFGRMLEKLFNQKVFIEDTKKFLNAYEIIIGNEDRFGNEFILKNKKFIKGIKFLYCPILVGATQTLFHRVKVEDIMNFDYQLIDKFETGYENSMNIVIKFFISVFWGLDEKQMLNRKFDKNSALLNKFMKNINNNKIENELDCCKIY